ncbi:glycoside hydrolase family 11 protein [Ruminococcus sp. HUN007]|uniref:glycoside hydrolase family 11 protein n=1 Tax=Ruminococcus sp. HUN007 TaxID=1514668 RepID=UPI0018CC615B|nr:glycoside hydrolase family 11 protein [Ruminococcus sp. HUN007]
MKHTKKIISGFIAMSMALSVAAPAELISLSDVLTVKAAQVGQTFKVAGRDTQFKEDNVDGYSYEVWLDQTGGSGSMTLGSGGTFSTEWSAQVSKGNFLARRGRNYDATKKATEYGPIVMDYAADYSASSQGNSRLCVYGWMKNPLVEYYIIEDWVNWCPKPEGASKTVTIDGAEYEIFQLDHYGPTINGTTETFKQYFSVRKSKRTSGTITVSDHFKAWAAAGWNIGNLTEVALNVEGWESSGKANVTKLNIGTSSKENPTSQPSSEPSKAPVAKISGTPVSAGTGLSTDCESDAAGWTARGDGVELLLSGDMKSGGSKALAVTGRSASWNGIQNASSDLKAGGSYSFSSSVGYKNDNYSSAGFTFGVQYDLNGDTNYDNIADATASSGKMTDLSGDFKIPAGAENISLYVQTAYSENDTDADLIDFFIDDIKVTGGSDSTTPATSDPGTPSSAEDFTFGDINDDEKIDITDLSLLAVHLIDKTKFTDKQTLAADVAYNGTVELADLATLRQFISKVIDKLGEGYVAPVKQSPSPSPSPSKQASPSPTAKPSTPSTFTSSGKTFKVAGKDTQFKNDNVDGYSYEIWLDQTGGSGSMTLGSGGTFSTEWSAQVSKGNFLARRGRNYDATKKATEYGPIVMDYAADYSASSQGNSRLCVYGWMKNPLVEYYIIEDWVNWCPKPEGASKTVTIDGAEYEIFQLDHYGPTILGTTETFKQYFSVRKSKRTSGTITVSDHFKAWAAAGWNIGNLTEVALNVEGWESSGKATVSKLTISSGIADTTPSAQPTSGQQVPQETAKSTGSKGKVVNGVWTSDADVSWIDASKPMVAISFDDGPIANSQNPGRIHNALTKNGFHATFFYWGERIRGNEQEIKNAFNAGFEVANHTWTHPNLTGQGDKGKSEVQKTKQALDAIIGGDNDYLLRPPYLNFDASVGQAVGVPCPNCGLDTKDWDGASKDQILNTLKTALANGSLRNKVVLCHENYDTTAGAMEEFLPYLKSQGWQCVTVSEMFKAQGKTMQAGQLYNECK